jgi:hypothetical protein
MRPISHILSAGHGSQAGFWESRGERAGTKADNEAYELAKGKERSERGREECLDSKGVCMRNCAPCKR